MATLCTQYLTAGFEFHSYYVVWGFCGLYSWSINVLLWHKHQALFVYVLMINVLSIHTIHYSVYSALSHCKIAMGFTSGG